MNDKLKTTSIKEDPRRIFRIMAEFVDSFEPLVPVTNDRLEALSLILDYERRVGPPEVGPRAFA